MSFKQLLFLFLISSGFIPAIKSIETSQSNVALITLGTEHYLPRAAYFKIHGKKVYDAFFYHDAQRGRPEFGRSIPGGSMRCVAGPMWYKGEQRTWWSGWAACSDPACVGGCNSTFECHDLHQDYPEVAFYDLDGKQIAGKVFVKDMPSYTELMEAAFKILDPTIVYIITKACVIKEVWDDSYTLLLYDKNDRKIYHCYGFKRTEEHFNQIKAELPQADCSAVKFSDIEYIPVSSSHSDPSTLNVAKKDKDPSLMISLVKLIVEVFWLIDRDPKLIEALRKLERIEKHS